MQWCYICNAWAPDYHAHSGGTSIGSGGAGGYGIPVFKSNLEDRVSQLEQKLTKQEQQIELLIKLLQSEINKLKLKNRK